MARYENEATPMPDILQNNTDPFSPFCQRGSDEIYIRICIIFAFTNDSNIILKAKNNLL